MNQLCYCFSLLAPILFLPRFIRTFPSECILCRNVSRQECWTEAGSFESELYKTYVGWNGSGKQACVCEMCVCDICAHLCTFVVNSCQRWSLFCTTLLRAKGISVVFSSSSMFPPHQHWELGTVHPKKQQENAENTNLKKITLEKG